MRGGRAAAAAGSRAWCERAEVGLPPPRAGPGKRGEAGLPLPYLVRGGVGPHPCSHGSLTGARFGYEKPRAHMPCSSIVASVNPSVWSGTKQHGGDGRLARERRSYIV